MSDEPTPDTPEKPKGKPKPVVLATANPYETFDPQLSGVAPITNAGVPVPASQATAVLAAAAAANVTLKES